MEEQPISQEQIVFNRKLKLFHGTEIVRYGFYILIITYPLISFQAVNRSRKKKILCTKRALGCEVKHKSDRSER